jgi:signal transduction histidine kinase
MPRTRVAPSLNAMTVSEHPPLITRIRRGHWLALDYLVAGGYALLLLPMLVKYASGPAAAAEVLGGLAAFAVPIAVRRRWPLPALGLLIAGLIVTLVAEPRAYIAAIVPMAYVVYLVATGPRRLAFGVLGVSLASAAAAALPNFAHLGATLASGLGYLTVWTVGYAVGMHRRYTADLLGHQAQLAQAELAQTRRGVTEERLRIARELHDVIAHSMSVITVQAALGALVIDAQPGRARSALDAIESTGRQTLSELRALLGVLRTADSDDAPDRGALNPSPSLADLDRLIAQTGHAGVRVQLTVSAPRQPLPAGVQLTAYRIVQEALTNVVRHAGASTARVLIEHRDDQLIVDVADDGAKAAVVAGGPPGHGLIGMRERVLAYGGTLHAAPSTDGGFRVHARIPIPAHTVPARPSQAA